MREVLSIVAGCSVAVLFCVWGAEAIRAVRRTRWSALVRALAGPYIEILSAAVGPRENLSCLRFPRLRRSGSRYLLARIAERLSFVLSGKERERIARLIRREGIDHYLLTRAAWSRGLRRAQWLRLLSALPLSETACRRVTRYETDADRQVRFQALVCRIIHRPEAVKSAIGQYGFPLNTLEMTEIALLLRDRFLSPERVNDLLGSPERNARSLGLILVRLLELAEVFPAVYGLCACADLSVRQSALAVLAALHAPMDDFRILRVVSDLSESQRREFYRRLVAEGYSLHALQLFRELERDSFLGEYLERLLISRKRMLRKEMSPV